MNTYLYRRLIATVRRFCVGFCIGFCLLPLPSLAQSEIDWDELMQQMAEELMNDDEAQQWEAQQERLAELHEHPLDINSCSREQLLALPFLSEQAVDEIIDYRTRNGFLRTLGELMLMRNLSPLERKWLHLFVHVPEGTPPNEKVTKQMRSKNDTTWWGKAKHEALARVDVPLYNRAGWPWKQGIANRWRYTWQQGRHLEAGLRAETDAGEAMMNRDTPLWDSYGGYVQLKEAGVLRTVILGDYKAGFGEGLVINNGLRFGKQSMGLWRTGSGIRPHRSTDEVNFLHGAAAQLGFGRSWQLTALYSYRKLDATVAEDNSVQSINTTGLHRTAGELRRRGSLGSQVTALHISQEVPFNVDAHGYRPTKLRWGATGMFQYYNHQFRQGTPLYRQILPEGYQMGAMGVDYGIQAIRWLFCGETARSFSQNARGDKGGWATLNKAVWRISTNTQLAVIQRFYSQKYYSPYASAFGENSRVQNESGIALQVEADHVLGMSLRAFLDYFYSPWPRYTMTRSSDGWEAMLQSTYAPHRGRSLVLRYSVKSKEQSDQRRYSHHLRATYAHTFSPHWSAQIAAFLHHNRVLPSSSLSSSPSSTSLSSSSLSSGNSSSPTSPSSTTSSSTTSSSSANSTSTTSPSSANSSSTTSPSSANSSSTTSPSSANSSSTTSPSSANSSSTTSSSSATVADTSVSASTSVRSTGFALAPRADFTSRSQLLRLSLFGVLFRTTDFDSRIYLYEPSLLQTFGMQQLYGSGLRLGTTLRLRTKDHRWTAQLKVGVTHYTDRDTISSGFLQIDSSWKADVQILVRMQLR